MGGEDSPLQCGDCRTKLFQLQAQGVRICEGELQVMNTCGAILHTLSNVSKPRCVKSWVAIAGNNPAVPGITASTARAVQVLPLCPGCMWRLDCST